jgi:hypothetical protein
MVAVERQGAALAARASREDELAEVEQRIVERIEAIVATRYNLGPMFQPDAIDRKQAIAVVHRQFARLRSRPSPTEDAT